MKRLFLSIILCCFLILTSCQHGNLIDNDGFEITGGIVELINIFNDEDIDYSYEVADSESKLIPGKRVFFSLFGEKIAVHQFTTEDKAKDFKK